jgi:hypothetical protein
MSNEFTLRRASHTGRLLLTPRAATAAPASAALITALTNCQFIGTPMQFLIASEQRAFTLGEQFFALLSFTGCAVQIATPGNSLSCYVHIPPRAALPILYTGRNTRPPRCPQCRKRMNEWREQCAAAISNPLLMVHCPHCHSAMPLTQWEWKQQGGCGRRFIVVEEIFPNEATPTVELLAQLHTATGEIWQYFYVQE